jgi:hypothetical protein
METLTPDNQFTEVDDPTLDESVFSDAPEETWDSAFVTYLVDRIMLLHDVLVGHSLHEYQLPFARRLIESTLLNDSATLTALASRQSGKSEIVANIMAVLMLILPILAKIYPNTLGKYKNGVWIGMFAPVEGQAETVYGRTYSRLTSERALEVLSDPDIQDSVDRQPGKTVGFRLKRSGSFMLMMTANPRAKIESKTFHIIVIDEAQEADDFVVEKSILPMGAYTNATVVYTGTPTTQKNFFYKAIQLNLRRATERRGAKKNHFQWTWKEVIKSNPDYEKYIKQRIEAIGEDSDEFQMSFNCKWLLERGMFVTSTIMDELGDPSMDRLTYYNDSPVVVGIDPARLMDSTVVTVVWVDWDNPDPMGYYDHRVLNWLELTGDNWEAIYAQIVEFLRNYNIMYIGVDSQGVGDAVYQRLASLMPYAEVIPVGSNLGEQSKRWMHLQALIQRKLIGWPAGSRTKRLTTWKRFQQQMIDAEKVFKGPNLIVQAPNEAHAHDDYVDSLAIACATTIDATMPTVEQGANMFYSR